MIAFTPQLQLETLFLLNEQGRIVSAREPEPGPGPRVALIRGTRTTAWATRADVSDGLTAQVGELVRQEPRSRDLRREPLHAHRYQALLGGRSDFGPAFTFPETIAAPSGIVSIDSLAPLRRYLRGWTESELPQRSPILGICEGGHAISVCFCARQSPVAAEAGVYTAAPFRGRGFAPRVTAAWALAIRASGRLPLYSTSWSNEPSLAVARKLRLDVCASDWSLLD